MRRVTGKSAVGASLQHVLRRRPSTRNGSSCPQVSSCGFHVARSATAVGHTSTGSGTTGARTGTARWAQIGVLECLAGGHAGRGVDVEELGQEVDEHGVVLGGVAQFPCTQSSGIITPATVVRTPRERLAINARYDITNNKQEVGKKSTQISEDFLYFYSWFSDTSMQQYVKYELHETQQRTPVATPRQLARQVGGCPITRQQARQTSPSAFWPARVCAQHGRKLAHPRWHVRFCRGCALPLCLPHGWLAEIPVRMPISRVGVKMSSVPHYTQQNKVLLCKDKVLLVHMADMMHQNALGALLPLGEQVRGKNARYLRNLHHL